MTARQPYSIKIQESSFSKSAIICQDLSSSIGKLRQYSNFKEAKSASVYLLSFAKNNPKTTYSFLLVYKTRYNFQQLLSMTYHLQSNRFGYYLPFPHVLLHL